jgi:hypothetical protein
MNNYSIYIFYLLYIISYLLSFISIILSSNFSTISYSSPPQSGIVSAGISPPYGGIARPKGKHSRRKGVICLPCRCSFGQNGERLHEGMTKEGMKTLRVFAPGREPPQGVTAQGIGGARSGHGAAGAEPPQSPVFCGAKNAPKKAFTPL